MKLIIVRHGEAEFAPVDSERKITIQGKRDVELIARLIKSTGWQIDEVRTSPLVRTKQTATIIVESLENGVKPVEENFLRSGFDIDLAVQFLEKNSSCDTLLWVFHMPDVARLASCLTGMSETLFYFPPGGAMALQLPPSHPVGRSSLIWCAQPDLLRRF